MGLRKRVRMEDCLEGPQLGNLERQILELSEGCMNHKREIEHLNEANRSLQSEMRCLRQEVEQQRAREETLSSELLDKTNEFELWEAEAATFYFDLQISSISEALLENKVTELTGVCMRLEDESDAKSLEIKQMTERVCLLESEIGGLKGQLSAYNPVISLLKEDFASLEHTALVRINKMPVECNQEQNVIFHGLVTLYSFVFYSFLLNEAKNICRKHEFYLSLFIMNVCLSRMQ